MKKWQELMTEVCKVEQTLPRRYHGYWHAVIDFLDILLLLCVSLLLECDFGRSV